MAVRVNKDSMNSPARSRIIHEIQKRIDGFERQNPKIETHISGLPLIRTLVAEMIQKEMKLFLWGSLLFSILILLLFFRSISTTILSMGVVVVGVVWTVAMIHLLGYKITLLTALLPSLVVVIGIPNCIYFINKYHTSYLKYVEMDGPERKRRALVEMVSKMGVVTLFCNITAAIGFAVFALTKSAILKEFGIVAGLSILLIFVVSFIMLPAVLSYLPVPQKNQLKYLDARWIGRFLNKVEKWVFLHKKAVWITTGLILTASVAGILQLRSVTFIVDDLPKSEKIYQDLKFFEKHFKGIMPLEIVIDSKKKRGLRGLKPFQKADSLATYIASLPDMNRPLALSEGLKFATQGLNENDPSGYRMPGDFEAVFLMDLMKGKGNSGDNLTRLLKSFMDQDKRYTRISVSMADVGTEKLPALLDSIQNKANQYFDTSYQVTLTGTSITFLEGSKFIVNGLKESIFWAFLLIALCMLYLFRSFRILLCSLIPNLVPLIITAGIMGWTGVPLKPSTVLVFSVALGIAVDITIRFLVNYRQVLPEYNNNVESAVKDTVQQTGLSIIYTSLVLMAGFIIFCASSFGGTFALGWLTSITLLAGTITNLVLLPILLMLLRKKM
jgi:predicted RND superfamily exporter protein